MNALMLLPYRSWQFIVVGWRVVYPKNTSLKFYPCRANAESIHSALVEYCREKNIQLGRLIGMRFDGSATFSGDKTRVQRRLKELSPHALFSTVAVMSFNWLLCKLLMLHQLYQACLHYPDDVMEVHSLLPKTRRDIKGDSESTRSSRAQDCETVRHMLAYTWGLCQSSIG